MPPAQAHPPRGQCPLRAPGTASMQQWQNVASFRFGLRALLVVLLIFTSKAEQELTDQVFEHDCRLCELDLILVLEISFGATGPDADVLPAEQARGKNGR